MGVCQHHLLLAFSSTLDGSTLRSEPAPSSAPPLHSSGILLSFLPLPPWLEKAEGRRRGPLYCQGVGRRQPPDAGVEGAAGWEENTSDIKPFPASGFPFWTQKAFSAGHRGKPGKPSFCGLPGNLGTTCDRMWMQKGSLHSNTPLQMNVWMGHNGKQARAARLQPSGQSTTVRSSIGHQHPWIRACSWWVGRLRS